MTKRKIYIWLFAILYISVAFVSTFHAIAFFSLANNIFLSVILAITFEVGQAAVLFSLLTKKKESNTKILPWALMSILTLVQILGNVFSSYKYLMTYAGDNLIYFKNPVFMWTDLPDEQCYVILSYIIGAILPIVALCMTAMLTDTLEEPENEPLIETTDNEKVKPVNETKHVTTEQILNQEEASVEPSSGFVNINK